MTSAADLLKDAEAQEAAARHCRDIGMNYLAHWHDKLAQIARAEAAKGTVEATRGTESS